MNYRSLSKSLQSVYSPRVALRPVSLADAWPLFEATKNPLFNQYLTWPAPKEEKESLERISLIEDAVEKGQMCAVSAVVRSTGEWIGIFRIQPFFHDDKIVAGAVETGIWARDTFWHGNYSLEVGVMCIDAAFKFTDVGTVYASAAPENRSSCALLRRGGLQPGRTFKKQTEMMTELNAQEFFTTRESWAGQTHAQKYFRCYDPHSKLPHSVAPAERVIDVREVADEAALA
jgi:RimJ/RimL family protein N-acetyltransferase